MGKLIEQDTLDILIGKAADTQYLQSLSNDELLALHNEGTHLKFFYAIMQHVCKELCNSVYGGFGTPSLRYFNQQVADDICAEGRAACQLMDKTANSYFSKIWPKDVKWHAELREKFPHIMRDVVPTAIERDIVIYADSVDKDSIIRTDIGSMTIEQLFTDGLYNRTGADGTEYHITERKVLNWQHSGLYYAQPTSVIRHKVTKSRWKIITESGKEIIVTGDHSLIVFRDGQKLSVAAKDVLLTDKVLTVHSNMTHNFEAIHSIEQLSDFDDEYVYDISMAKTSESEDLQTFIANDILVHNTDSNYVTYDYVFESLGLDSKKIDTKEAVDFIVYFIKNRMDPIYDSVLKTSIAKRNGQSTMIFELEKIGGFSIFAAKKKYVFAKLWHDGKYIADKKQLQSTGIELAQRTTPLKVRKIIETFVNTIFVSKGVISSNTFFGMCKSVKDKLQTATPADLAKSAGIKTYSAYVIDDKETIKLKMKCPVSVRGAARYNQIVWQRGLQATYPYLKDGSKGKMYYDTTGNPFCYPNDIDFPAEICPPMSVDIQLEKLVFAPIKRLVDGGLIDGSLSRMGQDKVQGGFASMFALKK